MVCEEAKIRGAVVGPPNRCGVGQWAGEGKGVKFFIVLVINSIQ